MTRLKLNNDFDLSFNGFTNDLKQRLIQRLKLFKGEFYLAIDDGVPYYKTALGQKYSLGLIEAEIKKTILLTPFLKALIKYNQELETETRTLTINFEALDENNDVTKLTVSL